MHTYEYMYIYTYVYIHFCEDMYMWTCVIFVVVSNAYAYTFCLSLSLSVLLCIYSHACMHACMYVCMYVCVYVCVYKHLGCENWAPTMGGLEGFLIRVWLCWLGGYGGWVTEFGGVSGGVLCMARLTQGHPWSRLSSSRHMATTSSHAGCTHTGAQTLWDGWSRKLSWSSCTWRIGSARAIGSSSPSEDDVNADGRNDRPCASGLRDGYCFGLWVSWLYFGNFCGLILTLAGLPSWQPVSGLCRLWRKWISQDGVREGMATGWFWNYNARCEELCGLAAGMDHGQCKAIRRR